MRNFVALLVFGTLEITYGFPGLSEKEFEEKFNILHNDPVEEAEAAKQLAKEEAEIEKQNELFAEGKGHFQEKLNPFDDMLPADFDKDKTGLKDISAMREYPTGLIWDPNSKNTPEELARLDEVYKKILRDSYPTSYDVRDEGVVTDVRDQGSCGSCAAFATGGVMEICLAKAGASLTDLNISEQQLIDCAYDGDSAAGCNGASPSVYGQYIAGKSINHENNYAYLGSSPNLVCQTKDYWNSGAQIDKALVDYSCSDDKIMGLIQTYGSALVALYASDDGFKNYASGVFDTCTAPATNSINHAVVAIGWGTSDDGIDYWIIRNSWGSSWGDNGYIKIKRGTCGVSTVCVALSCSASGSSADTTPAAEETDTNTSSCDLSSWFGDITGTYTLAITVNGVNYENTCTCAHGKCTPNGTSEDACTAICGNSTCP